ncbi:MAG TPA: PPK2 family polyphosphate kinase [Candidatus Paceibacterota bacterium]|nr:PPK2 family polyphosphate kinase [Candidatus Paceibacterota bacterium]
MTSEQIVKQARKLSFKFRVEHGDAFHMDEVHPESTDGFKSDDKDRAEDMLQEGHSVLSDLQGRLYAAKRWGVSGQFYGPDSAGKDGVITHSLAGVNPQGIDVNSFVVPTEEELEHDFMWRSLRVMPRRGRIGISNRGYYEEVFVVRVHPEILRKQKLPPSLVTDHIWDERFRDIRTVEKYLHRNGYVMLKFLLVISKEEQRKRLLARVDNPDRNWKFSGADLRERAFFKEYLKVYEDAVRNTASPWAPWYVVPANHKWFARLVVQSAFIAELSALNLEYPKLDPEKERELAAARLELSKKR